MRTVFNGMPAAMIHDTEWRKSGFSGAQGNCVELAETRGGAVAMRNSRDPNGPALVFTREELAAFFSGVKHGEFDAAAAGRTPAAASIVPNDPLLEQPDTSSRYRVLGDELQRITNTLSAGETVIDRDTAERLLRLLGAVSLLHRMHRVDRDGHCAICRTKHSRWHPGSRHDVCSVYAALSLHVGRALAHSGVQDDVPNADERQAG